MPEMGMSQLRTTPLMCRLSPVRNALAPLSPVMSEIKADSETESAVPLPQNQAESLLISKI
jgi:hypothetical protein